MRTITHLHPPVAFRAQLSQYQLPLIKTIIYSLFFISGLTGLVYEVTWVRLFTFVFGNTTYSVTAVLSAFLSGLGLGSWIAGRLVDTRKNPLKLYAGLEWGIALTAPAVPFLISSLEPLYAFIYQNITSSLSLLMLIKFFISFTLLLLPTFFMGATLPVISSFLVNRTDSIGPRIGLLYAFNTLGATLGCFFTGFVFIKTFGVRETTWLTALINLALGLIFIVLHKTIPPDAYKKDVKDVTTLLPLKKSHLKLILVVFAVAGFTSLAYEFLWTRLLVFKLKTTIYAFTIMLTTFLSGIGLGSLLFPALQKGIKPYNYWRLLGILEALIGLYALISIIFFGHLEYGAASLPDNWTRQVLQQMLLSAAIMFFPTLLMGITFPVVSRLFSQHLTHIGNSVGSVYSSNTIGGIIGVLLTGFFIVPLLGTQKSIIAMALINLTLAAILIYCDPFVEGRKKTWIQYGLTPGIGVTALVILLLTPKDWLFQYYNIGEKFLDSRAEILYAAEGPEGITTVHRYRNGDRVISTGSINVAGTSTTLRTTQKLQAHIPMLLHPHPKKVCQIGFGSGETARIVLGYDVDKLDLAEISPGVLEASDKYFQDINDGVIHHEKFHPFIMDGANYLRLTREKYDVIMNDSIWPYYAGNSGLYTQEHFLAGKDHLTEGGLMTSWLPLSMDLESFKILIKTFHSVFPHISIWLATTHYNKHALIVGSLKPINIPLDPFFGRFQRYAEKDLASLKLNDPIYFLNIFKFDESSLNEIFDPVALHTENNPLLEFAPSRTKAEQSGRLSIYKLIQQYRTSPLDHLIDRETLDPKTGAETLSDLTTAFEIEGLILGGIIKRESFEKDYMKEFEKALSLNPDHPAARQLIRETQRTLESKAMDISQLDYHELLKNAENLIKNGAADAAIRALRQALQLKPDSYEAYNKLGIAYNENGEAEKALQSFHQSIKTNPKYAPPYANIGSYYLREGTLDQGVEYLKKSILLNPEQPNAHRELASAYAQTNRLDLAAHHFEKTLEYEPENPHNYFNLGLIYHHQGEDQKAIQFIEKGLKYAPDDQRAQDFLKKLLTGPK